MDTTINSLPCAWPPEVWAKWEAEMAARATDHGGQTVTVESANYFTPRPYVDAYNRGSDTEGFIYTIVVGSDRRVCYTPPRRVAKES
jgi:hypothetical protein